MAKDSVIRSLPGEFETRNVVALGMGNIWAYELPLDYYRKLPAMIEGVTAEDTSRVAKQYVHPDHLLLITVGDRSKVETGLEELKLGPIEHWSTDAEPLPAGAAVGAGAVD
jgi:zinc protease